MISSKVSNGTLGGLAAAGVTAALVYYIPAFKNGLPGPVSDLVTAAVGAIGYFAAGYQSTHRATVPEVQARDRRRPRRPRRRAVPGGRQGGHGVTDPRGSECACVLCGATFTGLTLFDAHQDVDYGRQPVIVCRDPAAARAGAGRAGYLGHPGRLARP